MVGRRYPTGRALMALRYPTPVRPMRVPPPPEHIEPPEHQAWHDLVMEYRIDSGLGLELIRTVVEAKMRVRHLRAIIDREGEMVKGADGQKRRHPLLASEIAARAALLHAMRTLMKYAAEQNDRS
jgi:hypothetical protein